MRQYHSSLIVLITALGVITPLAAQRSAPADLGAFDAYVARAVRDWKVPGLAIAVVANDSIVFVKGYGVRELGKPGAVDADTRFAIGSTTKAMTAAALGMLVDEGKLRWDDPVVKHLPAFRLADPYVTRELTVRDLLTHRGGLPNADLLWLDGNNTPTEIVRRVGTLPLAYSLRSQWVYQNIMYAVAGDVVQAVSGMPWEAFLRTRIFAPLGMRATEPTLASLAGQPNVAAPHATLGDSLRVIANRSVDAVKAAGSVWSSVGDMAKWMRFVLDSGRVGGQRLLNATTYAEWLTPQTTAGRGIYPTTRLFRPRFFTYGLGWFLHDYGGEFVAMHTGSIDGMSAIIGLLPDRRVGVYVLANADNAELRHALMLAAFDLFTGSQSRRDWSAEMLKFYRGLRNERLTAQQQQEQRRVRNSQPSLPLDRYVGTYSDPTYGDASVILRDGALHFTYGRGRSGALTHWQYDTFRAEWSDPRRDPSLIIFAPDGTGRVASARAFGVTFSRITR